MGKLTEARKQFSITRRMIYLDAACIVPPPDCVTAAASTFFQDMILIGEDRPALEKKIEGVCAKFAGLINAVPEEIMLIKNTTEGINIAANGLPLNPGDNVIITDLEHLNNVYPWLNLQQRKGVEVRILKSRDGRLHLEDLAPLVDQRSRALAISFVTLTGLRIDLKPFGQFCKAHDMVFVVDAIQGIGRLRMDVNDAMIDIMSCGGHKGLMAPRGTGCLYIDKKIIDSIDVAYAGPPHDLRHAGVSTDLKRAAGIKKFNAGGANYLGACALNAGLDLIHEIGIDTIASQDLLLGQLLVDGLQAIKGVEVLSPLNREESSGIVAIETPDSTRLAQRLETQKIRVALRKSGIRLSPHFYNTEEEIAQTVQAMRKILVELGH
ncbi:MAG: aminotransferase class V-fold PLP-dependent enzyme [bacterium]|nr:aminotransferase class V-fold PLP-dependent enzyme [bacterium]